MERHCKARAAMAVVALSAGTVVAKEAAVRQRNELVKQQGTLRWSMSFFIVALAAGYLAARGTLLTQGSGLDRLFFPLVTLLAVALILDVVSSRGGRLK
jgi:hypothetical protein